MKKTVTVLYPAGHSRKSTYKQTDWYCLKCGKKEVWVEDGIGDIYEGPEYICTSCHTTFTAPNIDFSSQDENCMSVQISKQLLQHDEQ